MLEPPSKWLSSIWIIAKDSGICIFEQSFMDIKLNPDLVTGFLVAMLNFGKELADEDMRSIQFNNLNINIKDYELFTLAIASTDTANKKDIESFMKLIGDNFDERYKVNLSKFSGDVTVFNDFKTYVEKLVDKKSMNVELIKTKVVKVIEDREDQYVEFLRENIGPLDKFLNLAIRAKEAGPEGIKRKIFQIKDEKTEEIKERVTQLKDSSLNKISTIKDEGKEVILNKYKNLKNRFFKKVNENNEE